MPVRPLTVVGEANAAPLAPLSIASPICVRFEHVYTGRFPSRTTQVLLTSATKDDLITDKALVAVNGVYSGVSRRTSLPFSATTVGTPLIYYSPAVAWTSLCVTVELRAKGHVLEDVKAVEGTFANLAGIPIFAPVVGYLIGMKGLLHAAEGILLHRADEPILSETINVRLSEPGYPVTEAGFYLLYAGPSAPDVQFHPSLGLVDSSGSVYAGDIPCIVIRLDGAKHDAYSGFHAKALDATLLQMFSPQDGATTPSVSPETLAQISSLYSDWVFRGKAMNLLRQAQPLSAAEQAQLHAYLGNIKEPALRPSAAE